MKNFVGLLVSVFCTLAGCATHGHVEKYSELRTVFEYYKLAVDSAESEQLRYFTEPMWKALQASRKFSNPDTHSAVRLFNDFPNGIVVKKSVETINNDKGCLIVQGNAGDGTPVDYIITLVRKNFHWVFADISSAEYGSEEERWISVPVCESEQRHKLWQNTE